MSHPNIVEMYDVGEDNGQYYIVMEYVDGKTLKNLVKRIHKEFQIKKSDKRISKNSRK